jgi:hypothetical protein
MCPLTCDKSKSALFFSVSCILFEMKYLFAATCGKGSRGNRIPGKKSPKNAEYNFEIIVPAIEFRITTHNYNYSTNLVQISIHLVIVYVESTI